MATLSELTSTGKSGSIFYYTYDGKFTLKTIHREEFHFLKNILENYHKHITNPENKSLIIK
jgi:1-phosphatidylinositol-4-phosphate 5-kinase